MQIETLMKKAHENAVEKGFWDEYLKVEGKDLAYETALKNQFLLLIVSEIVEAQSALRKSDEDNFREELADVFLRLADFCEGMNINVVKEIKKKMKINKSRPRKHDKLF